MKLKCYHFCSNEFLKELLKRKEILATPYKMPNTEFILPEHYVKEFVFNIKKINAGTGMFFAWSNPSYKGNVMYDDNGKYSLIEFEVDEDICLKTNYENWCSLGTDLFDVNGDLQLADKYCREEFGIVNGLEGSYEAIYDISDRNMEVQILLPYLKADWIKSLKRVAKKYV